MCNTIFIGICGGPKMKQTSIKHGHYTYKVQRRDLSQTILISIMVHHLGRADVQRTIQLTHRFSDPKCGMFQVMRPYHIYVVCSMRQTCGTIHLLYIPSYMLFPSSSLSFFYQPPCHYLATIDAKIIGHWSLRPLTILYYLSHKTHSNEYKFHPEWSLTVTYSPTYH